MIIKNISDKLEFSRFCLLFLLDIIKYLLTLTQMFLKLSLRN